MTGKPQTGMSRKSALRMEYAIIGLGLLALVMIFQPFSLGLFSIGCMFVVLAGLINNLLPLAQPGVEIRSVITVTMVIIMIFCIVLLLSITAAHLYGVFFLNPPDPNTSAGKVMLAAPKFYMHPFVWGVAVVAAVMAVLIWLSKRSSNQEKL
jgi:hypothetical protein